jgi:hypothetical protein
MSPTLCPVEGRDAVLWAQVVKYTNVPPSFGGFKLNSIQWDIALRGEAANTQLFPLFQPASIALVAGQKLPELLRISMTSIMAQQINDSIVSGS